MMEIDGGREHLKALITRQLESLYLWDRKELDILEKHIDQALARTEYSLSFSKLKHSGRDNAVCFSPFHQGQYAAFLYFLSNTIYKNEEACSLPKYLSALNKCLNHIDLHHGVNMPDVFFAEHPLGTICARGTYGDFFFVIQGCTVGAANSAEPLKFPTIGKYVTMLANSAILGDCIIGDHVTLSLGAVVKNENVEDDCIVFGQSPNLIIKKRSREDSLKYADNLWKL